MSLPSLLNRELSLNGDNRAFLFYLLWKVDA